MCSAADNLTDEEIYQNYRVCLIKDDTGLGTVYSIPFKRFQRILNKHTKIDATRSDDE